MSKRRLQKQQLRQTRDRLDEPVRPHRLDTWKLGWEKFARYERLTDSDWNELDAATRNLPPGVRSRFVRGSTARKAKKGFKRRFELSLGELDLTSAQTEFEQYRDFREGRMQNQNYLRRRWASHKLNGYNETLKACREAEQDSRRQATEVMTHEATTWPQVQRLADRLKAAPNSATAEEVHELIRGVQSLCTGWITKPLQAYQLKFTVFEICKARFKAFFGIAERFGSKEHFHAAVAERGRVRNFCQHRSITCDRRMRKLVDEWMTRTTQDLTQLDEDLWRHNPGPPRRNRSAAHRTGSTRREEGEQAARGTSVTAQLKTKACEGDVTAYHAIRYDQGPRTSVRVPFSPSVKNPVTGEIRKRYV